MKKKLVAHQGDIFTVEWYYDDRGKSDGLAYFNDMPNKQKAKLIHLWYIIGSIGTIRNKEKFRYEADKIYAFKVAPDRFLCFFYEGGKIIITNAYEKKTDKMPAREKEKALKLKRDYEQRVAEGKYYEEND